MTATEVAVPFLLRHPSDPAPTSELLEPRAVGADKVTRQITTAPITACGQGDFGSAVPAGPAAPVPTPGGGAQSALTRARGPQALSAAGRRRAVPRLAVPGAAESNGKAWRHLPDSRAGQRGPGTWSVIEK